MKTDATLMCALLVGLPDVNVLAVDDDDPAVPLRVHVETTADTVGCGTCGTRARVKDRRPVALVDLAAFGRPAVLVWHKRRWCCVELDLHVHRAGAGDRVASREGHGSGRTVGHGSGRP